MSKATQERWHLHPSGKANCLGTYTVFYGHGEGTHNQICETAERDNARLIAAAPDLLAALKDLVESARISPARINYDSGVFDRAKAAIAKAESP